MGFGKKCCIIVEIKDFTLKIKDLYKLDFNPSTTVEETESQIAKIVLGNNKSSTSYVYALAEKAPQGNSELYMVAELPVLNPAAREACERICLAIGSTLKRAYKTQGNSAVFENGLSQVNEELGRLAALGQTEWINKLNCILAVKSGQDFNISTCGKSSAFLLRNKEYTDISCSQDKNHPLKTFENFAAGKIRLNDLLILSTVQLFNHISMDRLMSILPGGDFLASTRVLIELLKQTADPSVSFGMILNLQTPPGMNFKEDVDLEAYTPQAAFARFGAAHKIFDYIKQAFALPAKRKSQTALPSTEANDLPNLRSAPLKWFKSLSAINWTQKLRAMAGNARNFAGFSKNFLQQARVYAQTAKSRADLKNFKQMAPAKKFLLVSLGVLLVSVVFSIYVAMHLKNRNQYREVVYNQLKEAESLLSSSQASLLYKDDAKAAEFFRQATSKIPQEAEVEAGNRDFYNKVLGELENMQTQMEKLIFVESANLGSLGQGEKLIKLPNYLAVQVNQSLVSYNKQNGKIEDNALKIPLGIDFAAYNQGDATVVFAGGNLYVWDFSNGQVGPSFAQSVPQKEDLAGLEAYSETARVYLVDRKSQSIVSLAVGNTSLSRPVINAKDPVLGQAIDLAVDGNIYVLGTAGLNRFKSGRLTDFSMPNMPVPFSGKGKIYTKKGFANIYVLDSGNNRILVIDKLGNLINTIKSDGFTNLKDFEVDENNKLLYVLNDSNLLKVALP